MMGDPSYVFNILFISILVDAGYIQQNGQISKLKWYFDGNVRLGGVAPSLVSELVVRFSGVDYTDGAQGYDEYRADILAVGDSVGEVCCIQVPLRHINHFFPPTLTMRSSR